MKKVHTWLNLNKAIIIILKKYFFIIITSFMAQVIVRFIQTKLASFKRVPDVKKNVQIKPFNFPSLDNCSSIWATYVWAACVSKAPFLKEYVVECFFTPDQCVTSEIYSDLRFKGDCGFKSTKKQRRVIPVFLSHGVKHHSKHPRFMANVFIAAGHIRYQITANLWCFCGSIIFQIYNGSSQRTA